MLDHAPRPHPVESDLDDEIRERILELGAAVSGALDRDLTPIIDPLAGHDDARTALASLWDLAIDAMLNSLVDAAPDPRQAQLAHLLHRIRETEGIVAASHAASQRSRNEDPLRRVREALAELRKARTEAELLDHAALVGSRLGFARTMVSRVENATWKVHSMCIPRDPAWAEDILAVGKAEPPRLDGVIIETDIVERTESGLVFDVQVNPRVDRPLAAITRSTSYGVSPLTVNGKVVGLIHADRFHQGRDVHAEDRSVLALFAEGLSQCLAHCVVLDGLSEFRSGATAMFDALATAGAGLAWPSAATQCARVDDDHPLLTRREVEVIRLLADGLSNAAIARRLVISEATVKSHVTHILRKLGAGSRAEAVSHWLRSTTQR